MLYESKITVSDELAEKINHYLNDEPSCEEKCFGEDATITMTTQFDNGYQMDVKCCGVQFRENEVNVAWSEAVLFDRKGRQLCFTEPSDCFLGEWVIDYDGDTYFVTVLTESEDKRKQFEDKYYKAYQLDWMLSLGFSLQDVFEDIVGLMAEHLDENPDEIPVDGGELREHAERAKDSFVYDTGFTGGSMFVCKNEFFGAEFQDADYMEHLFSITHAPEKDREYWYRTVKNSRIPDEEELYRQAFEELKFVVKEKGLDAVRDFTGLDNLSASEEIDNALENAYLDMPEERLIETLKKYGFRNWCVAYHIDGRYYADVWAKDQKTAQEYAEGMYYDADFGILECVDSGIVHVEDDEEEYHDPV